MSGRYIRRGTGRVYWALDLCDPSAPTLCELDCAYDLTCDLTREISGLDPVHETVERAHVWSAHNSTMVGVAVAQSPVLTLLDCDDNELFHRALFEEAKEGYLILSPYGDVAAGGRVDVLACQSAGYADSWSFALQPATIRVRLAVTSETIRGTISDGIAESYGFDPAGIAVREDDGVHTLFDGQPYVGDVTLIEPVSTLNTGRVFADLNNNTVVSRRSPISGAHVHTMIDGTPWAGDIDTLRRINQVGTGTRYMADPSGVVVVRKKNTTINEDEYRLLDGTVYTGDPTLLIVIESRGGI